MYQNVGKELKKYAKRYVAIRTFLVFLMVFVGGLAASFILSASGVNNPDYVWFWLALMVIVPVSTYYRARLQAMQQYAFGELVECTAQIRDMISENM